MAYRYRSGPEKAVLVVLGIAIFILGVLVFTTLSGFFIYQPLTIELKVNQTVPLTAYLEIDGKNWPLPEGLPITENGYRIETLAIDPAAYGLGQGWHTINIIDLITRQKLFSAEIEITGNLVSVKD